MFPHLDGKGDAADKIFQKFPVIILRIALNYHVHQDYRGMENMAGLKIKKKKNEKMLKNNIN